MTDATQDAVARLTADVALALEVDADYIGYSTFRAADLREVLSRLARAEAGVARFRDALVRIQSARNADEMGATADFALATPEAPTNA